MCHGHSNSGLRFVTNTTGRRAVCISWSFYDCSAFHLSFKSQQQDISTVGKMKTLICLVLCALVASTYAAPASLEEMQAQLRKMQQHAEIEGFFSSLKNIAKKVAPYAKKGLDIYNKVNGGVEIQDDDDDDIAQMEAYLSNLQRQAEIEGLLNALLGKK